MQIKSAKTAEGIVLGMLINKISLILQVMDLKIDYFSVDVNKIIFGAIKRIYSQGSAGIDIVDVYAVIESDEKNKKILDTAGGVEYLELMQDIASDKDDSEIKVHVKSIIECSYINEMGKTLEDLALYTDKKLENPIETINKKVEKKILEVKSKYSGHRKIEMLSANLDKIMAEIEANANKEFIGLPTSLPLLNKFLTYRKGELVVYTAKAKVGKSQLVVNECYHLSIVNKVPIMVLDTELSEKEFNVRMLARITGYSFDFVEKAHYLKYPKANENIEKARELIRAAPLSHTYIVGWSQEDITNEVKRLKIQHNIQVVVYDYIKVESVTGAAKEADVLGNMANWLKNNIAGELDLAVIALAQMSDYNTEERGFKLANSEKIKNYASSVVFLLEKGKKEYGRDCNELGGKYYLFIPYNRHGVSMSYEHQDKGINIHFEKNKAKLQQAEYQMEEIINLTVDEDDYIITDDGDVIC